LNACYSDNQANKISKHIKYVIGMNRAIERGTAIDFSLGFYQTIFGNPFADIHQAFESGCNQIDIKESPEYLTPVLYIDGKKILYSVDANLYG
jgi:hypothetical protein